MTLIPMEDHGNAPGGSTERTQEQMFEAELSAFESVPEVNHDAEAESIAKFTPAKSSEGAATDDFATLEERVLRAVRLVREERVARKAAETRCAALEAEMARQTPRQQQLAQEMELLRREREQVKLRVERLLEQLDALEQSEAQSN